MKIALTVIFCFLLFSCKDKRERALDKLDKYSKENERIDDFINQEKETMKELIKKYNDSLEDARPNSEKGFNLLHPKKKYEFKTDTSKVKWGNK